MGFLQRLFGRHEGIVTSLGDDKVTPRYSTADGSNNITSEQNVITAPASVSLPTYLHLDPRQGDQRFEVADYYQFEMGSESAVSIRYDEWSEHDPGLERAKAFDEKFYNEVGPEDFARLFWQLARTKKRSERHARFGFVLKCAYSHREIEKMRKLAENLCSAFFAERDATGDSCLESGPYVIHATLLAERGDFDAAISVCQRAVAYGLADGTKGGFEARISRIRGQQARAATKRKNK